MSVPDCSADIICRRMWLVKYVKRTSGSVSGDFVSIRRKVCFIRKPISLRIPSYVLFMRTRPLMFSMYEERKPIASAVMNSPNNIVCRW